MILVENNNFKITVVIFSGMTIASGRNYIFEWIKSFHNFKVNIIAIRDPYYRWYQECREDFEYEIESAIRQISSKQLIFIGGSAGGFAALMFGKQFKADKIVTFSPQSACGVKKRLLGDFRWKEICEKTPSFDIEGYYPQAEIHVAGDDKLDILHQERLDVGEVFKYDCGGHDLAQDLKKNGKLLEILEISCDRR